MSKISPGASAISCHISSNIGVPLRNECNVERMRGEINPPCASLLIVQGALSVQHTPHDSVVIKTHVTVANTQTHDFITRVTNQVDAEVEVISHEFGGLKLHHLDFLPEDSRNCCHECTHGNNEVHVIVEQFTIVNLLKLHHEIISRGKGFGQLHDNWGGRRM